MSGHYHPARAVDARSGRKVDGADSVGGGGVRVRGSRGQRGAGRLRRGRG